MFNSNQAFLLVQKLKSAPRAFTLGVKANVQLKSSIPIGAKVEIRPTGPLEFNSCKTNLQGQLKKKNNLHLAILRSI